MVPPKGFFMRDSTSAFFVFHRVYPDWLALKSTPFGFNPVAAIV
jgi:hypothetical protein